MCLLSVRFRNTRECLLSVRFRNTRECVSAVYYRIACFSGGTKIRSFHSQNSYNEYFSHEKIVRITFHF